MHTRKYEQDFHNQIATLVCNHFNNNLPKKGKPLPNEWTTLAAIVQSTSKSFTSAFPENLSVVSCATGTRCLGSSSLSSHGDVIHDSHAEVLSRRCFLLYLFDQLQLRRSSGTANTIFNTSNQSASKSTLQTGQKYILSEGVEFHLFVSQLPCGDAAIIIDEEDINNSEKEDEPKSKKQKIEPPPLHRTGAKLQVGPLIYEEVQAVGKCRVKPGKGDPTLSMSCSDKIAKWQILGLQGCLLGTFVQKPIRLSSITIGRCPSNSVQTFSEVSLSRSIYGRFENELNKLNLDDRCDFKTLLQDYFVPSFAQSVDNFSNSFDPTLESNPCPSSIIWHRNSKNCLDGVVQVIVNGRRQGATKKNFGNPSAMVDICRRNILNLFHDMYSYNSDGDDDIIKSKSYVEAKRLNQPYINYWSFLKSQVFLSWTDKPENIQDFSL